MIGAIVVAESSRCQGESWETVSLHLARESHEALLRERGLDCRSSFCKLPFGDRSVRSQALLDSKLVCTMTAAATQGIVHLGAGLCWRRWT